MGKVAVVAVRRRLESLHTGANVYLSVLIDTLREAGFEIRLVFAPESAFGGLPIARVGHDFLERTSQIIWPGTLCLGRMFLSLRLRVWARFWRRLGLEIHRLAGADFPDAVARASVPLSQTEAQTLAAAIDAEAPDLVVAEYSALGPVLAELQTPGVSKAILLHDLFSQRAQTMRANDKPVDFTELSLEAEAAWCAAADMMFYASQAEREVFAPFLPTAAHHWLAPMRQSCQVTPPSGRPRALFMGVRHRGNLDALEFLMEEIWPQVIAQVPDAELCIVGEIGRYLKPEWRHQPSVLVHGIVEDLNQFGGANTIGLAPTRLASGISIKVAEYQRLGMAVLATTIALEGYSGEFKSSVLSAENAAEFADHLISLLRTPEQRQALASSGYDYDLYKSKIDNLSAILMENMKR